MVEEGDYTLNYLSKLIRYSTNIQDLNVFICSLITGLLYQIFIVGDYNNSIVMSMSAYKFIQMYNSVYKDALIEACVLWIKLNWGRLPGQMHQYSWLTTYAK